MNLNLRRKFRKFIPIPRKIFEERIEETELAHRDELLRMKDIYEKRNNNLYGNSNQDLQTEKDAFNITYIGELDRITTENEKKIWENYGIKKKGSKKEYIKETVNRYLRTILGMFGAYSIPTEFDLSAVQAQRRASWARYFLDPIAGNTIDELLYYAMGKGMKISMSIKDVEQYLFKMLDQYNFNRNQKWDFRRAVVDGIFIYLLEPNKNKNIYEISRIKSHHLEEVVMYRDKPIYYKISGNYFGEDDGKARWYKDARFDEFNGDNYAGQDILDTTEVETDGYIYTIFYGDSKYGEPYLTRSLRWFQIHEEFRKDVARAMHEVSRIILKKKIYDPTESSNVDTIHNAPPGGYELIEIPGSKEYEIMATSVDGGSFKNVDRILRTPISTGTSTPEHISFQDAANENYASVLEAKNPYVAFAEFRQNWYVEEMRRFFRMLLKLSAEEDFIEKEINTRQFKKESLKKASDYIMDAILRGEDYGAIVETAEKFLEQEDDETTMEVQNVPITIVAPLMRADDQLKMAQSMQIHNELGIPYEMVWSRLGYDPEEVLLAKVKQAERFREEEEEDLWRFDQGRSKNPPNYLKDSEE